MKFLLICALMAFAHPAVADWYFEASLEGGAEFWTYTNADGNVSPRRVKGDEIWITRTNAVNGLGSDGACSFDNCTITVYINGRLPRGQKLVKVRFSNGKVLDFQYSAGGGSDVLLSNFTTAGMGATGIFVGNIRSAEWVEINFSGRQHRFDLAGSSKSLDAIRPYLR